MLFGATGYTGRITAEAMVRAGMAPVLSGRSGDRLTALADELSPLAPDAAALPRTQVADVDDPASVRALLEGPDDVLVTTVGPFASLGEPAVSAAVDAGAAYVDSTGEPPFVRAVFERWGPRAEQSGARLLTAFGYDYVPGNLAGALALRAARDGGTPAARVDVGYFTRGGLGISGGTRASSAAIVLADSFAYRAGTLVDDRIGSRVRGFDVGDGVWWDGLSVGGSEHLALPRLDPALTDVGVYLGWAGRWTRAASVGSGALSLVRRIPLAGRGIAAAARAAVGPGSSGGPTAEERAAGVTVAVASAYDGVGRLLAATRVEGPSPYDLTGDLLAWSAAMLRVRAESGPGALGPADAFGLDALVQGCADLGLVQVA